MLIKILIAIALPLSASAAELTDAQKLSIREAQLSLMTIQAEKSALESRLKDLAAAMPAAQQKVADAVKAATPAGYTLQQDLTLKADPPKKEK